MEARAQARYVRVTPMKARRVVDLIRGLPTSDAQALLKFAPQGASEPVGKVLASAIANAANNHALDPRSLVVSEAYVDEGPTFKRFRPRAQGRAFRIRKRTSHITVVVSDEAEEIAPKPVKKAAAKQETAKKAPAKKSAEDKPAAKKAPAKKTAAKKTAAKKSAEDKPAAKKAPAKKTAAKKTAPEKEG